MTIFDYFIGSDKRRAKFIFNFIAPIYAKADKLLENNFKNSMSILIKNIDITNKTILDIGTGTGVWGATFLKNGAKKVVGIDFSEKMIKQAKEKFPEIEFFLENGENLKKFENKSFDIVTASFVLHGMDSSDRKELLKEMKRISKTYVLIHDFQGKQDLFTRFLEFMERSYYKDFKKNFPKELTEYFYETKIIKLEGGNAIYIGKK
jgi:ubiquinone/menaquinone biosynthesis C-methylase UbiE